MALKIEPFDSRKHLRANFSCGQTSLDNYIREKASQDLKKKVATVFVLTDDPNPDVLAYYTLSSYTIDIATLDESFAKRLPIAEALDEKALSFYIKYGFQSFKQEPMKLYLPMKSVAELYQSIKI